MLKKTFESAQSPIKKYSLSLRDAIHVSSIEKKIATIISDDEDFDMVNEIKRIPL